MRIDYSSTSTVTAADCSPTPGVRSPAPVTASSGRKVTLRTVRPTTTQMYEAPNGVPATIRIGPPYKARITETASPVSTATEDRFGCYSYITPEGRPTETLASGACINPLGRIHAWKGFVFETEREPRFQNRGIAAAGDELPNPLELE